MAFLYSSIDQSFKETPCSGRIVFNRKIMTLKEFLEEYEHSIILHVFLLDENAMMFRFIDSEDKRVSAISEFGNAVLSNCFLSPYGTADLRFEIGQVVINTTLTISRDIPESLKARLVMERL